MNTEQIFSNLKAILTPGQITELRVLNVLLENETSPRTWSGIYDDRQKLAQDALSIEHLATGCYFIPNPLNPSLAVVTNRLKKVTTESLTEDASILTRSWLLIDFDVPTAKKEKRPASDEELTYLQGYTEEIRKELDKNFDFPFPIVGFSGNGYHLMYPYERKEEGDDSDLARRALLSLASKFDTDGCHVDKKVYNLSRIWRLYGTKASRGDRRSCIVSFPSEKYHISENDLRNLIEEWPVKEEEKYSFDKHKVFAPSPTGQKFDIDRWIVGTGLRWSLLPERPWKEGGRKWIFHVCPFDINHNDRSAAILQQPSGALSFVCHHDGCSGRDWYALRDLVEPGWRERGDVFSFPPTDPLPNLLSAPPAPPSPPLAPPAPPAPPPQEKKDQEEELFPDQLFPFTDWGNAQRLIFYHGQDLVYCYPFKAWYIWQDGLWKEDKTGEIYRRMKDTISKICYEEDFADVKGCYDKIKKFEVSSQSQNKITSAIDSAKSEPGTSIDTEDFDRDHFCFNLENGTVDLQTGEFREHRRQDFCTKKAPIHYQEGAKSPTWINFLHQIMSENEEIVHFVQKSIGYSLTGSIEEQCFFICYGSGSNGKSTFIDTLRFVLGDYYEAAEFSSFMSGKDDSGPRSDIASLRGARFVSASEGQEGKRLDEALIKSLTGGDVIKCRHLYKDYFQYKPQFKIWLATNHLPRLVDIGHGMKRRIRLIPFTVTIDEEKIDRSLPNRLLNEASGILNWALEGCKLWMKEGLKMPSVVVDANKSYFDSQDVVGLFLDECCEYEEHYKEPVKDMYSYYASWCKENGEYQLSNRRFGKTLEDKGILKSKSNGDRFWQGIRYVFKG